MLLQGINKMKIYFRVFDFSVFYSLVNFTSVCERINKCSATLHAYGEYKSVQEKFHLRAIVKENQLLKVEKDEKI